MKNKGSEYAGEIENLIRRVGLEPGQCYNEDTECWRFAKGTSEIYLSLIEIGGEYYINIASPVMAVPQRQREDLFRRLLEENAHRIAVKFSLREDVVWLEINREMEGLTQEEATRSLIRVAEVADELDDVLINEFGEEWES